MVYRDPWGEGYDSASQGYSEKDNPYDKAVSSHEHMRWRSGWYDYTFESQEDNYCGGY